MQLVSPQHEFMCPMGSQFYLPPGRDDISAFTPANQSRGCYASQIRVILSCQMQTVHKHDFMHFQSSEQQANDCIWLTMYDFLLVVQILKWNLGLGETTAHSAPQGPLCENTMSSTKSRSTLHTAMPPEENQVIVTVNMHRKIWSFFNAWHSW